MSSRRRPLVRVSAVVSAIALAILTTGCQPEPGPTSSGSPSPSTSPTATTTPSATPSVTGDPIGDLVLPSACEAIYSPEMLATLEAEVPPLNDPGITMLSTQNVEAIEILSAAAETLRCTWGPPSERGIATNVTIVTAEQRDALFQAFEREGFAAEDLGEGTIHRIEQEMITQDDEIVRLGETHYIGGDGWISTRWINVAPEGYTEDIVRSLWD